MADQGPSYPAGVVSYAPDTQTYVVASELYEALLRNNSQNAVAAERRFRLLERALPRVESGEDSALTEAIKKELNGTSTLRSH